MTLQNSDFLIFDQFMRHPLKKLFLPFQFASNAEFHRMVNVEFLGNFSCSYEDQLWWLLSVQFSHSVVPNSLQSRGLQHARPPCPSPTPGIYSDSCPPSRWYHPTISSSVVPFSSYHQSVPVSGSFQMSQLHIRWPKYWSFSFSISSPNEYSGLIPSWIGWFDLPAVQGTLNNFLQHHSLKASILQRFAFFMVQLSQFVNDCWKNHSFDYTDLCQQSNVTAF